MNHEWVCYLCGAKEYKQIREWVRQCAHCSLAVSFPLPTNEELAARYTESYYAGWEGKGARRKMWEFRLNQVKKSFLNGKLLDVGCGSGEFLTLMKEAGFNVAGTEFSKQAIEKNAEFLIYPEIESVPETFNVITMWHVLEHLRDPKEVLKKIHSKLKSSGLLYVAVPNLNSFVFDLFYMLVKQKKQDLYTPNAKEPHLFHYNLKTLTLLLEQTGFSVVSSGLDAPQPNTGYYLADLPGRIIQKMTGINATSTFMLAAKKKET